ncbi:MAG TPA: hypothetical protein VFB16_12605 [Bauldia sp.]|nr:hypothetical protein [Bauldia sp.]
MDELAAEVAAATGFDKSIARAASVIMVRFLLAEAKSPKTAEVVDAIPGARGAVAASGAATPGMMGVLTDLRVAGVGLMSIQSVAKAFMRAVSARAGQANVEEVARSVPGLAQFM